jgi:hypothetical protein
MGGGYRVLRAVATTGMWRNPAATWEWETPLFIISQIDSSYSRIVARECDK